MSRDLGFLKKEKQFGGSNKEQGRHFCMCGVRKKNGLCQKLQ